MFKSKVKIKGCRSKNLKVKCVLTQRLLYFYYCVVVFFLLYISICDRSFIRQIVNYQTKLSLMSEVQSVFVPEALALDQSVFLLRKARASSY